MIDPLLEIDSTKLSENCRDGRRIAVRQESRARRRTTRTREAPQEKSPRKAKEENDPTVELGPSVAREIRQAEPKSRDGRLADPLG
jgi:hypothetical protein